MAVQPFGSWLLIQFRNLRAHRTTQAQNKRT
jgi:hypothetical protein